MARDRMSKDGGTGRGSIKTRLMSLIRNFSRRFNHNVTANEKSSAKDDRNRDGNDTATDGTAPATSHHPTTNGHTSTPRRPIVPPNNQPLTPPPLSPEGDTTRSSMGSPIQMRPPLFYRHARSHSSGTTLTGKSYRNFRLPDLPWLCGTWHVTHSTLPMWRDKRNVRIVYTRLPNDRLDDLVTYQRMDSTEVHAVHGRDTPKSDGAYVWRGKGLLKVASSRWEVLGWGGGSPEEGGEQWVVTYFLKTLFTPAGIDIYSRRQTGLSDATVRKLQKGLMRIDGRGVPRSKQMGEFARLVGEIHAIRIDGARPDIIYGQ